MVIRARFVIRFMAKDSWLCHAGKGVAVHEKRCKNVRR